MADIHDTLGESLPPNLPLYPQALPPVRPPPTQSSSPEPIAPPPALNELQTQLHDTQSSLANHVDKVRALEGVFAEYEAIKRGVPLLRSLVEGSKGSSKDEEDEEFANGDDDDARSICTVVPHELERVNEEDAEHAAQQEVEEHSEERRRQQSELGRPCTPEPTHLGMSHPEDEEEHHDPSRPRSASPKPTMMMEGLTERLTALSNQLEAALELSTSLQAVHRRPNHHLCSRVEGQRPREPRSNHPASPSHHRSTTTINAYTSPA